MQFKHPEILYFLFLLVIPILVHLFQLRRFKKEYFTNVRFLKALSIQTRKSSKIKKWLLLVTRLLIYTCLILAFAQPFFRSKDSNSNSNEMYIVLDNSFSMQAKGQKGELLKRAVEDLLEHAPENKIFSLITNSEVFWNTDIKSIQKELQNMQYSALPFQLESAIAKIKSRKSAFNKDIIIITDAIGIEQNQLKSIDKNFNTFFSVPKAEQKNNIAVDSVFIQQTLDNFYEIGIRLSVHGEYFEQIPVAIYNKTKLIAKTRLKINSKEKIIYFTIPKEDFQGYVTITDNGLEYDNTLFFSISNPEKINVLSIGETEKSPFLSRIYTKDEFNYSNYNLKTLDYNLLEKQDAIILNELEEIPQALQTTLKSFVEKGGNLVFVPSHKNTLQNINAFLNNFGKIEFKALQNNEKLITKIAFNNPIYNTVFEKQVSNFQYPKTKSLFGINTSNPAILSYEDQNIFLTSLQNQFSSVYVFAAEINKNNSNFQNSPLIVPTFYNMAQSAQKKGLSAMIIGNNNTMMIDALLSKDEIINIKTNSGNTMEKFIPIQQILNNKVKVNCNDFPENAGNFGVYKKEELLKNISFNFNRTESNLVSNNENLLAEYKVIDSIETVFDTLQTDRTNTEIWKWFVFLTLLFLAIELLIQKFVK
jgi:hypothetical protein